MDNYTREFVTATEFAVADVYNHSSMDADPDPRIGTINRVGHGTVIPLICLIGMVLNMLNLIVLLSHRFPESTYTYLTCLAVADFLSLLLFGINGIGRGHYKGEHNWSVFEVYVYFPCGMITTTASVLATVTVTVERVIFLYKPHRAKSLCRQPVARRVVTVLWIVSVVCNIPRFFVFEVSDGKLSYTDFGVSDFYAFLSYFYFFVMSIGSSVALIVLNAVLIRGIHKTHEKRRHMAGQHNLSIISGYQRQEETRLTRTVISVIFLFIIGEVPSAFVSRTAVVAMVGHGNTDFLETFSYKLANCCATGLVVSQHSLNFFVYCVFNRRFFAVFRSKMRTWRLWPQRTPMRHLNGDSARSEQHILASMDTCKL